MLLGSKIALREISKHVTNVHGIDSISLQAQVQVNPSWECSTKHFYPIHPPGCNRVGFFFHFSWFFWFGLLKNILCWLIYFFFWSSDVSQDFFHVISVQSSLYIALLWSLMMQDCGSGAKGEVKQGLKYLSDTSLCSAARLDFFWSSQNKPTFSKPEFQLSSSLGC